MIWLLFILIAILLYINYMMSYKDLFNPAVVLMGVFVAFSFFAV